METGFDADFKNMHTYCITGTRARAKGPTCHLAGGRQAGPALLPRREGVVVLFSEQRMLSISLILNNLNCNFVTLLLIDPSISPTAGLE